MTGVISTTSFYGNGEGPPFLILHCTGTETSIFDCRHDKLSPALNRGICHEGRIVGITCEGDDMYNSLHH